MVRHTLLRWLLVAETLSLQFDLAGSLVENKLPQSVWDEMDLHCPKANICRTGNMTRYGKDRGLEDGYIPCCADCSCEDDCGLTNTCCFDSLDIYRTAEVEDLACEYTTTATDPWDQYYDTFYLVDKCPEKPTNNGSQCGDTNVGFWGSLHPFYSPSKDRIYKNEACLDCHGVKDGIEWIPVLKCLSKINALIYLENIIQNFLDNFEESRCDIHFSFNGSRDDIIHHKCYKNAITTCTYVTEQDINIKEGSAQSVMDIQASCESGLISPVKIGTLVYLNAFCQLCDELSTTIKVDKCIDYDWYRNGSIVKDPRQSFSCMLDINQLQRYGSIENIHEKQACRMHYGERQETAECRTLLCPTSYIRRMDGSCGLLSNVWFGQSYRICVNLTFTRTVVLRNFKPVFDYVSTHGRLPNNLKSPFGGDVQLRGMYYLLSKTVLKEIIILLNIHVGDKFLAQPFLDKLRSAFYRNWILKLNGKMLEIVSKPSTFCVAPNANYRKGYTWSHMPLSILTITKLYFCEQVQLLADEVTVERSSKNRMPTAYITYTALNISYYFYDNEFGTVLQNNHITYRFCADDILYLQDKSGSTEIGTFLSHLDCVCSSLLVYFMLSVCL